MTKAFQLLAKSGLNAMSLSIGQIAGGKPGGAWATSDWVPSFVKSSLALGALPDAQGVCLLIIYLGFIELMGFDTGGFVATHGRRLTSYMGCGSF